MKFLPFTAKLGLAATASAGLLPSPAKVLPNSRRDHLEKFDHSDINIMLADCGFGVNPDSPDSPTEFHVFAYAGKIWDKEPDDSGPAPNQWQTEEELKYFDGDYAWSTDEIHEADLGDYFQWEINVEGEAAPGKPAGYVQSTNGRDINGDELYLYCWPFKRKAAAVLWGGDICDSAFVCNRNANDLFAPERKVDVEISNDQTKLRHSIDVNERIYGLLKDSVSENGGICKDTEHELPGGECKIKFDCNAPSQVQMNGFRNSLKVISENDKFVWIEDKDDGSWSQCPPENLGRPCHQVWQPHREITTFLPSKVKMVYYEEDNMQGMLEYTITCDDDACGACVDSSTAQDIIGGAIEEGFQGVIGSSVDVVVSCMFSALTCALS